MMQILVPFRNVAPWFEKCLESIRSQTHKDWACYLIDDGSTDGSDKIAKDVAKTNKKFVYCCPVKMCENGWERYRAYQLGCYRFAYRMGRGILRQDICVAVDGDDWLPDNEVFRRVEEVYRNPITWLTYGSYVLHSGESGLCNGYCDPSQTRTSKYTLSHLKTWKSFLFERIRESDFYGPDGQPLRVAGDVMMMMAMVEMAGCHAVHMPSINYVYNKQNPESNFQINRDEQLKNTDYIRSLPVYDPLDAFDFHQFT